MVQTKLTRYVEFVIVLSFISDSRNIMEVKQNFEIEESNGTKQVVHEQIPSDKSVVNSDHKPKSSRRPDIDVIR